ncbi:MAG: hypothetical protein AVDCRST_MAG01-01-738, partial [uncultured Rubrobacteraceae bacterium]
AGDRAPLLRARGRASRRIEVLGSSPRNRSANLAGLVLPV